MGGLSFLEDPLLFKLISRFFFKIKTKFAFFRKKKKKKFYDREPHLRASKKKKKRTVKWRKSNATLIDLQTNCRLLQQLDNNSHSLSNGSIATATSTTATTKTMMTKRPFKTNAENSIATEQKKETHAERQSRIKAKAVAFAFSGVTAKELRRRQKEAAPVAIATATGPSRGHDNTGKRKKRTVEPTKKKKKPSTTTTKKRKQTATTTPPKKKAATGIMAQKEITPALAAFLGTAPKELVARTEVVKRLWAYIKENDLQTPDDRRTIRLDPSLQDVFGQHVTHFTMFTMNKYISAQLAPYPPVDLTLLSAAEQKDAKNSKERERYWNDPQVVAKQAERERIAKVKQAEREEVKHHFPAASKKKAVPKKRAAKKRAAKAAAKTALKLNELGVVGFEATGNKSNSAPPESMVVDGNSQAVTGKRRYRQKKPRGARRPYRWKDSFVFPPIPTSLILEFQSWIKTRKISWKRKRNQLAIDPTSAPDSFVTGVATVPTSLSMFLPSSKQVKRSRKYFDRQFGVAFKPKEEIKNNTVTVITESDPETNTTMSLTIAPAEHNLDCHQVCGTLPVSKTVRRSFATGHGICLITTLLNYYLGINKVKFHTFRSVSSHLSPDLIGGIHQHGLVPLQSIEKDLNEWADENVWMGALHAVPWMVGHVIENQQEELQQCDNQLVCIVIPRGDPRLDLFHQFGAPGWYKDYVNPVKSPFIVLVSGEDTVGFPANAIPQFILYEIRVIYLNKFDHLALMKEVQ